MTDADMRSKFFFFWKKVTYVAVCRLLFFFYILVPVLLKLFPSIFLHTVFSNKYKGPVAYVQLTDPEKEWDFIGASNHYIASRSGSTLGVWHLPPDNADSLSLEKADKVILYCHGKAGNRGTGHRIGFYGVLREMGFHIVTFDYSGFGDSSGNPDGQKVMFDTISVYEWTLEQIQRSDAVILVWGHSLGSGILVSSFSHIARTSDLSLPHGVILECPFTNLFDASEHSNVFRLLDFFYPYFFRKMFKYAARYNHMEFETEKNLPEIKSNILILHSNDDPKVNVNLAQKLYDSVVSDPLSQVVSMKFYRLDGRYSLGHNHVYSFKHLRDILSTFVECFGKGDTIPNISRYQQFTY